MWLFFCRQRRLLWTWTVKLNLVVICRGDNCAIIYCGDVPKSRECFRMSKSSCLLLDLKIRPSSYQQNWYFWVSLAMFIFVEFNSWKRQFERLDDYRLRHVTKKGCSFISSWGDNSFSSTSIKADIWKLPTSAQLSTDQFRWIKISVILYGHFYDFIYVFENYDLWYGFFGWLIKAT